jgi:Mg-chelatase subunit ChlI
VNLLPDHITDDILDAAASGWNVVEREAISVAHPSRFILIGTMNPEEGELRPQLMDRFALHVAVEEILDEAQRVEIIRNNLRFGEAPEAFRKAYADEQRRMRERILQARERLGDVRVPDRLVEVVARACITLNIDGHRPDIVTVRAAKTLTALEDRQEVTADDLLRVASMAIGFRTRREGFEEPAGRQQVSDAFANSLQEKGVRAGG